MAAAVLAGLAQAQSGTVQTATRPLPPVYVPTPGFDAKDMDPSVDPCTDFYKFACGKYAANHPIPADAPMMDPFYEVFNINNQSLAKILKDVAAKTTGRTPEEQKIGDYYNACMDVDTIEKRGLAPIASYLAAIDGVHDKAQLAKVIGTLQRVNVDVFFGYGEQQDFKDATKQIASISQGGLGLPEKDYYLRTGEKDRTLLQQYDAHIAKMLTLAGTPADKAAQQASKVVALETALAKGSMSITDMRDPEKTYHLKPVAEFEHTLSGFEFGAFEREVHSPQVTELNDATPQFWPVLTQVLATTDLDTLQAYMRYHLLTAVASRLPKAFDEENFDFNARKLYGTQQPRSRDRRCSVWVDSAMGEALGKLWVEQYFSAESKAKMLQMVGDIEAAMERDIDTRDWMSAETKQQAKQKLHLVANKIGYPDKWRDYSTLEVRPEDAAGNLLRANEFENDRQLNKIGKPVDRGEWLMSPPTVNAYYDPSMNDINFPAGILQPAFYDKNASDAVNYGHIGSIIGHELTHGFDDEGRKFDGKGNLSDWWTAEDAKQYEQRGQCLVDEYSSFTAVDDVKLNGKLTLGENTADNGGLTLAFMAYMQRARMQHVDLTARQDGYTPAQHFFRGFAQNYCETAHPELVRTEVLSDPHSPDDLRVRGVLQNQPDFAAAFGCKKGSPMVPANSCRVW
ncbi:MAG: M13 family metallopeptidase [Acidobacteriota bacterium]|nr:M13 family metallopeptidase [Acidobacteriota bacterium]